MKSIDTRKKEPVLVSLALSQALKQKQYQYQPLSVRFIACFEDNTTFTTIDIDPSRFQRIISNIINNAVAAYEEKEGDVHLDLSLTDDNVIITIRDNGKGIPPDVLHKIRENVSVTSGKKGGHGIGLAQVQDTVKQYQGSFTIDSTLKKGTIVTLQFPKTKAPAWLAESIAINEKDTVVILDDDQSIHKAWKSYFEQHKISNKRMHFTVGQAAVDYINQSPEKDALFLLTDYELLQQDLNGVQVIEKTSIKRAIVVTSHYADPQIRSYVASIGIKMLPKQLASDIAIYVNALKPTPLGSSTITRQADIVVLDDSKAFTDAFEFFFDGEDKQIDVYNDPDNFLYEVSAYSKDTVMCLDYHLSSDMTGLDIAKKLHKAGYKKLYILSGQPLQEGKMLDYAPLIRKTDIEAIKNL